MHEKLNKGNKVLVGGKSRVGKSFTLDQLLMLTAVDDETYRRYNTVRGSNNVERVRTRVLRFLQENFDVVHGAPQRPNSALTHAVSFHYLHGKKSHGLGLEIDKQEEEKRCDAAFKDFGAVMKTLKSFTAQSFGSNASGPTFTPYLLPK